jgi:hypothetical protein
MPTAQAVLAHRHEVQVMKPNADAALADVVEREPFRDVTHVLLPDAPMGLLRASSPGTPTPVAVLVQGPVPIDARELGVEFGGP